MELTPSQSKFIKHLLYKSDRSIHTTPMFIGQSINSQLQSIVKSNIYTEQQKKMLNILRNQYKRRYGKNQNN